MKKLFKKIAWYLKGAPVCKRCGRPITTAADIEKGAGAKCRKETERYLMEGK